MQYLIESAICLSLFYALYFFAFRRETFFQFNRLYLLGALALSMVLPALNIRLEQPIEAPVATPAAPLPDLPQLVWQAQKAPTAIHYALQQPVWRLTLGEVCWWIYLGIAVFMTLRLLRQIGRMIRFIRHYRQGNAEAPVSSFLGFIFLKPADIRTEAHDFMYQHELVHVRQWHSLDIILIEIAIALQWFNPLLYLYRRSLREVHEYIADAYVVGRTRQPYGYARLLVQQQTSGKRAHPGLVNTFHSLIKQRLIMLAKHPSHPARSLKYLLALPVLAGLALLFSFRLADRQPLAKAVENLEHYTAQLADIQIVSQPAQTPPYIFYWGVLQAHLKPAVGADDYYAEIHTSPEELREAIKREPRLWDGRTLLQNLSFAFEDVIVKSNYDQPAVYESIVSQITEKSNTWQEGSCLSLRNIRLPDNQTARVDIFLDKNLPSWLKPVKSPASDPSRIAEIQWSHFKIPDGATLFLTQNDLFALMDKTPKVKTESRTFEPEKWEVGLFANNQFLIRLSPKGENATSFGEIRQRLLARPEQLQTGATLIFLAFDTRDASQTDTLHLIDPVTLEQTTMLVDQLAGGLQPLAANLFDVVIVPEDDPRLFLKPNERRNFQLEIGDLHLELPNRYARCYQASGGYRPLVCPDPPFEHITNRFTKAEALKLIQSNPILRENREPTEGVHYTLDYNGHGVLVKNGQIPADYLDMLEKNLKPGDVLKLTAFQAQNGGNRDLVFVDNAPKLWGADLSVQTVETVDVRPVRGQQPRLIRIRMSAASFKEIKNKIENTPGSYLQYGDIDLTTVTIALEIRNDDPKPPLRPVDENNALPAVHLSVSPNPARERMIATIDLRYAGEGTLQVFSADGKQVFSLQTDFPAGQSRLPIPTNLLRSSGLHIVRFSCPHGEASVQCMITE